MKKKLIAVLAVVVVVIVVAAAIALLSIDHIAKLAVEEGGTYALGVPTTLKEAKVGLFAGTFSMEGLTVANPEGFTEPHFLSLDDGRVAVSLASLRADLVELPTLDLSGVDLVLSRREGRSNYDVILDNLKRLESGEKPAAGGGGKRFVIHAVDIRNVHVHADLLPVGGDLTRVDLPIDEIKLADVGSETTGGMLLSELWSVIIKALFAAVIEKGGELPGDILGGLQSGFQQLEPLGKMGVGVVLGAAGAVGEGVKGAVEGAGELGNAAGNALEGAGKGAEDVLKGVGGLLGGSKEKKPDEKKDSGGGS